MADLEGIVTGLRPLRRVGPPESPWEGCVARDPAGRTVLLVDAETVDLGAFWAADPRGHIAAPLDLERRADGQDLVLPLCVAPVLAYLAQREQAGRDGRARALSTGEGVTLLVSVLRAARERYALRAAGGSWWLTDAGMPMLVAGAADDTEEVLATIARLVPSLGAEAERLSAALAAERRPDDREDAVFAIAPGEPLDEPGRAGAVPRGWEPVDTVAPAPGRWFDGLFDAGLVAAGVEAVRGLGARISGVRLRGRRGLLLLAGAGVALVLAAGLLWPAAEAPSGSDQPADAGVPTAASAPGAAPSPPSSASPASGPATDRETPAEDAARGLLVAYAACRGDCAALVENTDRVSRDTLPAGDPAVALVEDFGDVAVVRANYPDRSVLVVIVRDEERWRLRDVYATEPPP